ncbi:MAG: hypothetical protein AVDCRST_MAG69-805 [uncultured Solirubrobacteraceae bacterium]|uniref:Phytase-like domain-containing protein n=1 Tax=uncultured Solirubrobacteraceae bacterium TaxID=1162706 RepID=A0A6J4RU09_9ACTN|nr:MAG: hypothetical protein AVDCRST_MAG69-805 [uncultured Solirubrobacteraceae bacterium]
MDQRTGTMERLPPLQLRRLRGLDLTESPGGGRGAHIASASGVVRRGDFVYVIGDDELYLGVFRMSVPEPGEPVRVLDGNLPEDAEARSDAKPDLEALTMLPPFRGHAYGALLGLGSGSGPDRDRGFVWALNHDGSLRGEVRDLDLAPLFERLRDDIDGLNIEGACVMGDRLWLMHRGNRGGTINVVAELSLERVMDSILGDSRIDPGELAAMRSYDLGELDGIELTFSDTTPLGRDLLVFTASAEGSGSDGPDGAIRGSVVGTIGLDGQVQRLRTIDRRWKVEGVHASIDTGVMDLLFVCDQDDPDEPSPLLSAAMPLEGGFESEED